MSEKSTQYHFEVKKAAMSNLTTDYTRQELLAMIDSQLRQIHKLEAVSQAARDFVLNREAFEGAMRFRDPWAADLADDEYAPAYEALVAAVIALFPELAPIR